MRTNYHILTGSDLNSLEREVNKFLSFLSTGPNEPVIFLGPPSTDGKVWFQALTYITS